MNALNVSFKNHTCSFVIIQRNRKYGILVKCCKNVSLEKIMIREALFIEKEVIPSERGGFNVR